LCIGVQTTIKISKMRQEALRALLRSLPARKSGASCGAGGSWSMLSPASQSSLGVTVR
jgi:hypothetical protein